MFTMQSCNECRGIDCANGGTCNDGECDCLKGYEGENCEVKDICVLDDVVCVFGDCNEGICTCNEGIEKADCSVEAREKFIGYYRITEYAADLDTISSIEIEITKDLLNIPDMDITNLFNNSQFPINGFFSRVRAVATPNTSNFRIPGQSPDGNDKSISGSGSITASPDSTVFNIEMQYTVTVGNKEYEVTALGQSFTP